MNFNQIIPYAYQGTAKMVFYFDMIYDYPYIDSWVMILKSRMTGERVGPFTCNVVNKDERSVMLSYEITNAPDQVDWEVGVIYIRDEGYWDYELFNPVNIDLVKPIPASRGSIYFYIDPSKNDIFPQTYPEIDFVDPQEKGYDFNDDFEADVYNSNPIT